MNISIDAVKIETNPDLKNLLYHELLVKTLSEGNYVIIYSYIKISDKEFKNLIKVYKLNYINQEYVIDKTFALDSKFTINNFDFKSPRHHPEVEMTIGKENLTFSVALSDFNNLRYKKAETEEFDPHYTLKGGQDIIHKIGLTVNRCMSDALHYLVEEDTIFGYNNPKKGVRTFKPRQTMTDINYIDFKENTMIDNLAKYRYEAGAYFLFFTFDDRKLLIQNTGTSSESTKKSRQRTKLFVNEYPQDNIYISNNFLTINSRTIAKMKSFLNMDKFYYIK